MDFVMDRKTTIRLLVVIASIILMGVFLYPSFVYYSKPLPVREEYVKTHPAIFKKIVNLGLDLQGGMRLVLEIDRSNVDKTQDKDPLDRAFTVIENRINGLGVAEPSIQKQGKDRIIVELPGLKDEKRAKGIIGQTAQLEFMLLRDPVQLEQAIKVIDIPPAPRRRRIRRRRRPRRSRPWPKSCSRAKKKALD
jgi:SecD/SecF fusion protein